MIAAAATITVILFVLAAGASFGQFGLGSDGGTRAQASAPVQQSGQRESDDDHDREEYDDDEDEEDGEEGDDEHEDEDDDREDGGEHEDEDD
jgi:hypothetical protein